jgi:hypothetical protein
MTQQLLSHLTDNLRQRIVRLKDKYGVSYRNLAKEAEVSQSHLMRFIWGQHHNLTTQTLSKLDETVSRLSAKHEAK